MDRERDADPELSLADYARILRNRWLAVLTPILIFGGLAAYSLSTRTLQYESTSKVLLADTAAQAALRGGSQNPNSLTREMTNEISFAASDDVKNAVRDAIGVVPKVTVRADPNSDVLSFLERRSSPGDAAMYANTWAEAFVSTKQRQAGESLDAAVDQFSERVAVLRAQAGRPQILPTRANRQRDRRRQRCHHESAADGGGRRDRNGTGRSSRVESDGADEPRRQGSSSPLHLPSDSPSDRSWHS
ncbi:MAG: hypothetical protein R2710_27980 [Acidimicrobiales bacterium]